MTPRDPGLGARFKLKHPTAKPNHPRENMVTWYSIFVPDFLIMFGGGKFQIDGNLQKKQQCNFS